MLKGIAATNGISLILVFLEGVFSFFSPCVIPLIPVYISYLAGNAKVTGEDGVITYRRKKVFFHTLFFILGISFAFFILGMSFTALGSFFSRNKLLFTRIGGILIVLLGLFQLGIFDLPFLQKERKLNFKITDKNVNPLMALVMGFTFSFAWTPCIGPALSSVLIMASGASSSAKGYLLVFVYAMGFLIPFLLLGTFTTQVLDFLKSKQKMLRYTVKAGGVILIAIGIMIFTGWMNGISSYLNSYAAAKSENTRNLGDGNIVSESESQTAADANTKTNSDSNPADNTENNTESNQADNTENNMDSNQADNTENNTGSNPANDNNTKTNSDSNTADAADVIPAFDFTLTDQYGTKHTLSDYKGKVVFLNFYATWCPPCNEELPDIEELYQEYNLNKEDVVFLGVTNPKSDEYPNNADEKKEDIIAFLEKKGYTFPTVFDETGEILKNYNITAFPTTFMIDKNGNIYGYVPGMMTKDIMKNVISETLQGK